jgi:glucose/arabinose dehydrogenase
MRRQIESNVSRRVAVACFGLLAFAAVRAEGQNAGGGDAAGAKPVLKGRAALDDWKTDAPGVRRLITPADMPAPGATKSVDNGPKQVARPQDAWPKAPAGFVVELVADKFQQPRKILAAPNGDLFVAESRGNRVALLRFGPDGKVQSREIFAEGLNRPFGIAFYPPGANPTHVYVGNTDAVVRFPYRAGELKAGGAAEKVADLPGGGQLRGGGHWTRDVVFAPDGKRMYVSVGSKSNNDDDPEGNEKNRATILSWTPDGKDFRVHTTGIRNAVGLAIEPATGALWASVNERDGLGDDLVPDYVTRVQEGGFYGWPWYYIGKNQDPKHAGKRPELADKVVVPDVLIQPHSASLCMTFYTGGQFPAEYRGSAFAAQHGSWNRSHRTGYKVIRVPVKDGKATGEYEDFLTGFVVSDGNVWGRPVGVAEGKDGALFVSDDAGNVVWRVRYEGGGK